MLKTIKWLWEIIDYLITQLEIVIAFIKLTIMPSEGVQLFVWTSWPRQDFDGKIRRYTANSANLIVVSGSAGFCLKWVGKSQTAIWEWIFRKAKAPPPSCVLVFDGLDSLARSRGCGVEDIACNEMSSLADFDRNRWFLELQELVWLVLQIDMVWVIHLIRKDWSCIVVE